LTDWGCAVLGNCQHDSTALGICQHFSALFFSKNFPGVKKPVLPQKGGVFRTFEPYFFLPATDFFDTHGGVYCGTAEKLNPTHTSAWSKKLRNQFVISEFGF
jgi:hypothetical protein